MAEPVTAPQIEVPPTPEVPAAPKAGGNFNSFVADSLRLGQEQREFSKSMLSSIGALLPQEQKALDYQAQVLNARKGQLDERAQELEKIGAEGKENQPPGDYQEPPAPRIPVKAFGEGREGESAAQTLQRTMLSLGLMAQMGMGIAKSYPQGALAAFAGAMRGWQEGDREAAQREWLEYQAQVGKAAREWRASVQRFEMLRQQHSDNIEQFKLQLGLDFARNGADDQMVQLMFRAPEEAQKILGMQGKVFQDLFKFNQDLNNHLMTASIAQGRLDTERQHLQLAKQKAEQEGKPLGEKAAHWTNAQGQHPSPLDTMQAATAKGFYPFQGKVAPEVSTRVTLGAIDQVLALMPALKEKKLFMEKPGLGPWLATTIRRHGTQIGDPDLDAFVSHTSTLIRTARELGDVGFRAQAAITGTTDLVEKAKTFDGVFKAVHQLRNLVTLAAPSTVQRSLRVFNTQTGKYQTAIFEPGETLNDLPTYMDPNR